MRHIQRHRGGPVPLSHGAVVGYTWPRGRLCARTVMYACIVLFVCIACLPVATAVVVAAPGVTHGIMSRAAASTQAIAGLVPTIAGLVPAVQPPAGLATDPLAVAATFNTVVDIAVSIDTTIDAALSHGRKRSGDNVGATKTTASKRAKQFKHATVR